MTMSAIKAPLAAPSLGRRCSFCRWSIPIARQKSLARRRENQDGRRRCDGTSHRASKKKQEDWYSGKKKRHTVKSQIVADVESRLIYDVEEAVGSVHDFKLCKETLLTVLMLSVMILADSGYQGIQEYHTWSLIPIKKSKNRELSEEEKAFNRELSRRRIVIENINARIKVFKIMSYPYRNRRRRHLLRTKLVCAILNAEKA